VNVGAVARGAATTLVILLPAFVLVRLAVGDDSSSPLLYLVLVAFLLSFTIGGAVAGHGAPDLPLKHAAAAGAVAFGIAFAIAVVRNLATGRAMTMGGILFALVLWGTATTIATIGALVGRRRQEVRT